MLEPEVQYNLGIFAIAQVEKIPKGYYNDRREPQN